MLVDGSGLFFEKLPEALSDFDGIAIEIYDSPGCVVVQKLDSSSMPFYSDIINC